MDNDTGSFRWAITNANATPGSNVIAFKITGNGPFTLNISNALPIITNVVFIDGTTETNFNANTAIPIVELNGARAGGNVAGLDIQSSNCTVRGLVINRFSGDAIFLEGSGGNVIQGNYIGTGIYGTNVLANGTNAAGGIQIVSPNNLIGGVYASNRNLISGNTSYGINANGSAATGNIIQGNFIGPDITGNNRFANGGNGIMFTFGAASNTVGGALAGAGNLISGNGQSGISILSGNGNVIQGNYIGVNRAGTAALYNSYHGITILGGSTSDPNYSRNSLIGGTNTAARNVISGNGTNGITVTGSLKSSGTIIQGNYIGVSSNGLAKIPNGLNGITLLNASSNIIGGTIASAGNLISGNAYHGIFIGDTYARKNLIQNNLIGVDATGTNTLGNGGMGVWLSGYTNLSANVSANTIGPGNVISGNGQEGVRIDSGAKANLVQGNFIGTDSTGQRGAGNTQNGVRIESPGNTIGGLTAFARNIISGNTNYGIYLFSSSASNTLVQGNFIGTDRTGTTSLGNGYSGIGIVGAPTNTIGGTANGGRNFISGNTLSGISIISNTAYGNVIQGNYIGTDANGTSAIANGAGYAGNAGGGIDISAAPSTLIGGTASGAGNLISGNHWDAIAIGDSGASNSVIQGNLVGVKTDGISPLGNEWAGVEIRNTGGGNNTVIGGNQPGAGNLLANATLPSRCGVRIQTGAGNTGVLVRGNSIYNNGGSGGFGIYLGAFLSAITPNDSCDTDTGANQMQNYPVLAAAYSDGKNITITGALNSTASSSFLLQFYNNTITSNNVQGQYFLGDLTVATGLNCASNHAFTARFTNAVTAGQVITATATDASNNTSEFSPGVPVLSPPPLTGTSSFAGGNPQLTLLWPTNGAVFALVQTTNLTPPIVWSPLTNLPVVAGTNCSVTLISTNDQRYYRLSF